MPARSPKAEGRKISDRLETAKFFPPLLPADIA
jgi:hypothetical protein